MKTSAFRTIVEPVNTEKARLGWAERPEGRVYTFVVSREATKAEIRDAVEKAFSVKVKDVRTLKRQGKTRRVRAALGRKPDTKRAIVTLAPDQKISFFDGI